MELSEHAVRNRAQWNEWASDFVPSAEHNWATPDVTWGVWDIPERDAGLFGDAGIEQWAGTDVIELGCGAGYVSSWLARAGARVMGIDVSDEQLATARRLHEQHLDELAGSIEWIQASAEAVPLPDASFDLAISEYGACLWCDPQLWVPEAARLLRPGGQLVFLTNGVLQVLCMDEPGLATTRELHRPLFGMHRMEWDDDDGVEFHLSHGEWIRLLGEHGLQVERLIELRAPEDAGPVRWQHANAEWSRSWPFEEAWVTRRA